MGNLAREVIMLDEAKYPFCGACTEHLTFTFCHACDHAATEFQVFQMFGSSVRENNIKEVNSKNTFVSTTCTGLYRYVVLTCLSMLHQLALFHPTYQSRLVQPDTLQ